MHIDSILLDSLTDQAKSNPRLRQNYDLRNSSNDQSQRMLNAMEPGTFLPIHRHMMTSEILVVLRGAVRQNIYDNNGNLIEQYEVRTGTENVGFSVPIAQWHMAESLESGTVILECKDGPWAPLLEEEQFCCVLKNRIMELMQMESRSCSLEPSLFTPEYVFRMWSGQVPLDLIKDAMKDM